MVCIHNDYVRNKKKYKNQPHMIYKYEGAGGVMVIAVGNRHGDTSSNPGRDWLHFT